MNILKSLLFATLLFLNLSFVKTATVAATQTKIAASERVMGSTVTAAKFANLFLKQQAAPDAVVRNLYKVHTPEKGILDGKSRVMLDKLFDKNLADLIWTDLTTHKDEVGVIDFDPFYNAQDFEIKNLLVGRAKTEGGKTIVPVTFTNANRKNLIRYVLVKQNGAWKISDVRYDAKNSLLGFFKEAAKK